MQRAFKVTGLRWRYFKPKASELMVSSAPGKPCEINLKKQLIQGANPYSEEVHIEYKNFQGGFRCEPVVILQPENGVVTDSDDKLGLVYTPNPGFVGRDSFPYKLVSSFGQESNSACIIIFVGV